MSNSILLLIVCTVFSCGGASPGNRPVAGEDSGEQIPVPEGWQSLICSNALDGWEIIRYGGEGEPYVRNGVLTLPMAVNGSLTGVRKTGDVPTNNYTMTLEARRINGNDFFLGLTFPYNDTFATFIAGGWGGSVCGLSSIDGYDASENETTGHIHFKNRQWYPVCLRVTPDSIRISIDTMKAVSIGTAGKKIHLRPGSSASAPLGLSTYLTTGEIRNIFLKKE
ncbi:MAG: DUF1080 domain-containing protein [Tannerella sp.]|nr:DUF1080 domain-containing protein [Tannerella sp.]